MKEFNWEEFKDKNNDIAVHCKTRDEAINFFKQMHKHNMRWRDGISYLETTTTHWEKYEAETTYSNRGAFCSKQWYEKHHYTILEWSGYMQDITAEDKKTHSSISGVWNI